MRLRDGESNMLAGLIQEEDSNTLTTFPGLSQIPVLRALFGNNNGTLTQNDIVMIVTPHIVRSHELTAEDLKPMYVGTQQNFGAGTAPQLISPNAPPPPGDGRDGGRGAADWWRSRGAAAGGRHERQSADDHDEPADRWGRAAAADESVARRRHRPGRAREQLGRPRGAGGRSAGHPDDAVDPGDGGRDAVHRADHDDQRLADRIDHGHAHV